MVVRYGCYCQVKRLSSDTEDMDPYRDNIVYGPPTDGMPPPYAPPSAYQPPTMTGQRAPQYVLPMPAGPYSAAIVAQPGTVHVPINTEIAYAPGKYEHCHVKVLIHWEVPWDIWKPLTSFSSSRKFTWLMAILSNIKTNVKFDIINSRSELVFRAEEENVYCNRECCGSNRSFDIYIKNASSSSDVIALHRPLRCCGCCLPCFCLQQMLVEAPPGYPIGRVQEEWTLCAPRFTVYDERDRIVFRVTGPCRPSSTTTNMGQNVNFNTGEFVLDDPIQVVEYASGQEIGRISKQWAGFPQEAFTNATNFNVLFPLHESAQHKALLLSMALLLNFMYFETTPMQHRQRHNVVDDYPSTQIGCQSYPDVRISTTTTTY
ncbi:phospholipid scramblase 2-like [Tropilaelaps mercedesae]|uniref:Phospholipid scramblase n=1 Tax=Tropilaelaps mercedesae TaxID=418985 RepID=A0A1V9XLA7_9ACAR|nr:phospholipid scramblase 2-like [Tropilaelaps mercedesae]